MTVGCIWGYWDRWHDGMTASLTEAMRICDGDDLHIVIIDGATELNTEAEVERADANARFNDVKDRVIDIRNATGYAPKAVYHRRYNTLQEAITDGGSYPFDVLFAVEHDHDKCTPFDANIAALQSSRSDYGREPAQVHVLPSVCEEGTQIHCSSTRIRKREKIAARRSK